MRHAVVRFIASGLVWAVLALGSMPGHAGSGNVWEAVAPLPVGVTGAAVAVSGGKIYAAGGDPSACCAFVSSNVLQVYDPSTNVWTLKRPMPAARHYAAAAAIGNYIYVIGGFPPGTNARPLKTVERYDIVNDTWSAVASMPMARAFTGGVAAAVAGKIYVIGGYVPGSATTVMEIYDPASDSWTNGPPMPVLQFEFAVAVLDNKIMLIGDDAGDFRLVQQFDPATNQWTTRAPLLLGRRGLAAAAVSASGPVYALGGTDPSCRNPAEVERYDPLSDTWKYVASLPFGRFNPMGAAVNGLAYVFGGANNPGCGSATPLKDVLRYVPLSCEGVPPKLSALVAGKSGTVSSRGWSIAVSNVGECPAEDVQVDSVTLAQTYGTHCAPRFVSPTSFPIVLGDLAAGTRRVGAVTIDFGGCQATARFTVRIDFSAAGGTFTGSKTLYNQYR